MTGIVYLIEETGTGKKKIGITRRTVEERRKEIQTSLPSPCIILQTYQTQHLFLLERLLHQEYKPKNCKGEWFDMSEEDVKGWKEMCERKERIAEEIASWTTDREDTLISNRI